MGSSVEKSAFSSVTPRQVANKRSRRSFRNAIRMALDKESDAVRHNTQSFNRERYRSTADIDDYEELKKRARAIKEQSIENLPALLSTLEIAVASRGGHIYHAQDGADACSYIQEVCKNHNASLVVKSKSMTSEEIKLNRVLEGAGIEVVETDLGEFIIQIADEQPSHIIGPAIHRDRERISELFKSTFTTDHPLDTGEDLTKFARDLLRKKFLTADVGITGANVISADTGTLLLIESEGNIRMVTQAPPVHIAVAGIEKVVPTREDLAPFFELLGPSATGQPLTSYTNIISPPLDIPSFSFNGRDRKKREFHFVLLDNGRTSMSQDSELREALYCIRCGACSNVCANFQVLGGHAFGGETYSGGIGGSWEAGTGTLANARFSELCTGCARCIPQCPVNIDIPWLNVILHNRLNRLNSKRVFSSIYSGLVPGADRAAPLQKQFFGHFNFFSKWGSRFAPVSNWISALSPARWLMENVVGLDRRRQLPHFAPRPLVKQKAIQKEQHVKSITRKKQSEIRVKAVLFADVYTNYTNSERGIATLKVLKSVGVDIILSDVVAEGRASLSQGMMRTARQRAQKTAAYLEKFIDEGRDVVVVEPSVLALFRRDYAQLLDDDELFNKLKDNSCESVEYLLKILQENHADPGDFFSIEKFPYERKLFYHSHCQQRTVGASQQTVTLLEKLGFDLVTSDVECCGMGGSFGYKKDYYEVSMRVGEDLFAQIEQADSPTNKRTLVASGVSCSEQISAGTNRSVFHPMELLAKMLV